ncbi:hypothetical protein C7271_09615 [filamentous cyanobacterium CCP5]|nr:hypothetical protein C7271_09615 [filamentous cyanobacterium CCP5]
MRPHTAALYSIALFALLRPGEQPVPEAFEPQEPEADADVEATKQARQTPQPSAKSSHPDGFMYEFLHSEELAATPLLSQRPDQAKIPGAIASADYRL